MCTLDDGSLAALLRIVDDPRTTRWRVNYDALARQNDCPASAREVAGCLEVVVPLVDGPIRSVCERMDLAAALIGGSPPTTNTADQLGYDQLSQDEEPPLADTVKTWWTYWLQRHPGGAIGVTKDLDPPPDPPPPSLTKLSRWSYPSPPGGVDKVLTSRSVGASPKSPTNP
jgi:hypothetical protein